MKTCNKCGIEKSLDDFHRDKSRRDGLQPHCKDCKRGYYQDRQDHYKSRARANSKGRSAARRVWQRGYRESNRERIAEYKRNYYAKNVEYRMRHLTHAQKRRALQRSLPAEPVQPRDIVLRDGAWCWLCGDELSELDPSHMDHLIPLAADPAILSAWSLNNPGTVLANMSLACPPCNNRKSNRIMLCAVARYLKNLGGASAHEGIAC